MANTSQKSHLNRKNICFSLNHCYMDVSMLGFAALQSKERSLLPS